MFNKITSVFTTAAPLGVGVRYYTAIICTIISVIGILGWLTPQQVQELTEKVPDILTALATLITLATSLYAIIRKSSSDKAAKVAKEVDAKVPPAQTVQIPTPAGVPDIVVPGTRS